MKNKKYKYLTAASSFAVSVFMLFDWFIIKAMGTQESHSFITIPSMLTSGADFLKQLGMFVEESVDHKYMGLFLNSHFFSIDL